MNTGREVEVEEAGVEEGGGARGKTVDEDFLTAPECGS
jgi:hypothetical protein